MTTSTDRSSIYALAPHTSEWPVGAKWWAVDLIEQEPNASFWAGRPVIIDVTEPGREYAWAYLTEKGRDLSECTAFANGRMWCDAPAVTLPAHISWKHTLVSLDELEAWEAEQQTPRPDHKWTDEGIDVELSIDYPAKRSELVLMLQTVRDDVTAYYEGIIKDLQQPPADPQPTTGSTRELLAQYAHNSWAGWMHYLFSKCKPGYGGDMIIPAEQVQRWQRQMTTAYIDLGTVEQESDRKEANKILAIIAEWHDDNPQPAEPPPQVWTWTDEAIRLHSRRYGSEAPYTGMAITDMMRVRDDTAAARDAHWQARLRGTELAYQQCDREHEKAKQRITELEQSLDVCRRTGFGIEQKLNKARTRIAELEQKLDHERAERGKLEAELIFREKMEEQAAQLWQFAQTLFGQDTYSVSIDDDGFITIFESDTLTEVAQFSWDELPHAIAHLEAQQPEDGAVSVDEIMAKVEDGLLAYDGNPHSLQRQMNKVQKMLEQARQHGIKEDA